MQSFSPIISQDATTLILGTFPSITSLDKSEYYGHKRNAFWPIMEALFNRSIDNYSAKKQIILSNKLALWDVCNTCERKNSEDSTIKDIVPNKIKELIDEKGIKKVIFNGKTAANLYKKEIGYFPKNVTFLTLFSTSPADPTPFEEKRKEWKKALFS